MEKCTLGVYGFFSTECRCNSCRENQEKAREYHYKKQFADHEIAEKKARRERIATALLAGIYSNPALIGIDVKSAIENAINDANSLVAALDEAKE